MTVKISSKIALELLSLIKAVRRDQSEGEDRLHVPLYVDIDELEKDILLSYAIKDNIGNKLIEQLKNRKNNLFTDYHGDVEAALESAKMFFSDKKDQATVCQIVISTANATIQKIMNQIESGEIET